MTSPSSMHETGLSKPEHGHPRGMGWEVGAGFAMADTGTPMADSHQRIAKAPTIL